jgi:hypothetical protein
MANSGNPLLLKEELKQETFFEPRRRDERGSRDSRGPRDDGFPWSTTRWFLEQRSAL